MAPLEVGGGRTLFLWGLGGAGGVREGVCEG